jgi:hypothetical protein
MYYPCSWYQQNHQVLPYEFSDEKISFNLQEIEQQLHFLKQLNYHHYGITVRPIRNTMELETPNGHIYVQTHSKS